MLNPGHLKRNVPERFYVPNMILLAGSGQNVGKTTFATELINYFSAQGIGVYGLKITPHFHEPFPENLIVQTDTYQVALEKNTLHSKDSSRMLLAGAQEVFFAQTRSDDALPAVFDFVYRMSNQEILWICESGGLRNIVQPGLFLYFKKKDEIPQKASAKQLMPMADRIVEFDGKAFDLAPDLFVFRNGSVRLKA